MVWLLTIASLMGFLAVDYLAAQSVITSSDDKTWGILSFFLMLTLLFMLFVTRILAKRYRVFRLPISAKKTVFLLPLLYSLCFCITLLMSASFGLYQYQVYQQSLLKSPLTTEAIVRVDQISDTLNQTIPLQNQTYSLGTGFSRQLFEILPLNNAKDLEFEQPINALVTIDTVDHPDWQKVMTDLQPGQQIQVKLQLQPIHRQTISKLPTNAKSLNLGFVEAQWLRQRNVQAKGRILSIQKNSLSEFKPKNFIDDLNISIEKLRWHLRQKLTASLSQHIAKYSSSSPTMGELQSSEKAYQTNSQSYAILLGLLTGDKALMDSQLKNLYQVTGISHLLAISGPHVLMLATFVSMLVLWLVKVFMPKLLVSLPSSLLVLWVSVVVAGFYAILVGFEIPAQRTFWMLMLLAVSKQWLVRLSSYKLLACIALGMMWFNPATVGQAGFWLSFVAVGLLLKFSEQVAKGSHAEFSFNTLKIDKINQDFFPNLFGLAVLHSKNLLKLQIWLFIWMMPIVIWFFGKLSVIGILTNLFAVPFLGLIIVPLDMLAGVLSWTPILGDWLSEKIWSLLAQLLQVFHYLLSYLVEAGLAKQSFFALSKLQLVLCALIGAIWFLRGLLPRMLILPIFMLLIIIPVQQRKTTNDVPTLAVLDNPTISITLLVKGDESWLILADNVIEKVTKSNFNLSKSNMSQAISTPNNVAANEAINKILDNEVYPLLANQHISKLTGVISQTPSPKINQLVQQLAGSMPIQHYWLAGYDALKQNVNKTDKTKVNNFQRISPKGCLHRQTWQTENLSITAVSGWNLALPLSDQEQLATQACFIQITHQSKTAKPFSTLLLAGNSELTMQMGEKLCSVLPTDLMVTPHQLPIKKSWLTLTQPKLMHVLTGDTGYQQLSEDSQLTLVTRQTEQADFQVTNADQVGAVVYQLTQPPAN